MVLVHNNITIKILGTLNGERVNEPKVFLKSIVSILTTV